MKKTLTTLYVLSILIFVVDWGIMGIKLLDHNYDITTEAYIGAACWLVIIIFSFYRLFTNKCPHCGKVRMTNGDYCSYCGKKIDSH